MPSLPVSIGPLSAADIPICIDIMANSFPWTRYEMTEATASALWHSALASRATVAVAHVEGRAAGFAWYIRQGGFGLSGYLKLLGVHPAARGRGVGGALLDHVEWLAGEHQQRDLFLLVSDFNQAAQRFYLDRGYAQVGALPDYVMPGITELIFRKSLAPEPN